MPLQKPLEERNRNSRIRAVLYLLRAFNCWAMVSYELCGLALRTRNEERVTATRPISVRPPTLQSAGACSLRA